MSDPTWRLLLADGETRPYFTEEAARADAPALARETDNWVGIEHYDDAQWWLVDTVGKVVHRDYTGPSRIVLGDYVRTHHHGHTGRVTEIHHTCPEGNGWLAMQTIDVSQYKNERWVSILCHNEGSVTAPMALVDRIEPFTLKNRWSEVYFRD